MSIVKLCPYDINGEHCKYEIYYGEPIFLNAKIVAEQFQSKV